MPTTTHKSTLENIKKTSARKDIIQRKNNPKVACRRDLRRNATNQRVHFSLHDPKGGRCAWGTAILLDYSPNGALLGHLMFDEGFWPDGEFGVSFKITGGKYEGVYAYGEPLRFATSKANLAVRFDGLYVKL